MRLFLPRRFFGQQGLEFGYKFLEVIQQARRQELGDSFKFTPGDLRLPARLYKLRKSATAPAGDMDKIARLLNKGHCDEARKELEAKTGKSVVTGENFLPPAKYKKKLKE